MYSINGSQITLTRGDSFLCNITITNNGSPYTPAQDDVIRFALKKSYYDAECLIEKTLDNSTLNLYLGPDDTKDLDFNAQYVYDIELTNGDGDVFTFISGVLLLTPEVE